MADEFIPLAKPTIHNEEIDAAVEVLKSGWWTTGPKVAEFEQKMSEFLKVDDELYTVGLNSCTSALHLALLALGIKEGDEVIVPTWTFAATAQVVEWTGATLVLCDVEADTLNIDVQKAKSLITEKTKAIIPVHIAGFPCNMEAIATLANEFNLKVVEDAAHAIGTEYLGEKIGNFSDITCFSFYATKNLAMGEGGAAVSKDSELVERIRKLSYFGINKCAFKRYEKTGTWFYDIEEMGYTSNLDSVHAAVGLVQLKNLDDMNRRRREIASFYKENLSNKLTFFKDLKDHYHTYHLFMISLPITIERNIFIEKLRDYNIGTSVHFRPLHLHSYYANRTDIKDFPVANEIFDSIVSIPMYPSMSDEDVKRVVDTINLILDENG